MPQFSTKGKRRSDCLPLLARHCNARGDLASLPCVRFHRLLCICHVASVQHVGADHYARPALASLQQQSTAAVRPVGGSVLEGSRNLGSSIHLAVHSCKVPRVLHQEALQILAESLHLLQARDLQTQTQCWSARLLRCQCHLP